MAVQINVAANQAALTASIQAGVQAYNQKFAQNNQINLSINQRGFSQPLGRITGDVKDFEAALAASNARVIAFGASTAVLGGVIRSFKELANVTIEVEKNLADINRVFGLTTSQLQKFSTDLFNVTKLTASSFNDASQAALEFSRQGLKAEETLQRTKDALTLTRLAGISTANAVDALTSTVNGFAATGISTTQILNKLVAVEQDYAVGAGDLAEALSRTGQAAQEAGVSLDQLNALVTSAQQSTARGGAVIGNALKTIFTRLQRTDTLDQLEAFNISVRDVQGNILPAVQILQNFAGAYKGLADAQRAQLSEQVAGVYQVNILKAIVNDLNKSQGTYAGALQRGAAATNEAEVATAKLNQTLDALLKQTATSTQQLANNIGKVTFEPLAKYGTEQLKSFIESLNEVLEGEGVGSTFANGLLKGIRNVIAGPGAIAAFFTLFKLIQNSFTYLSQALPQIAGITTETQNRKNIEQSILQIMQQQGPVSQALAGNMGNQAAQAQLLLQVARQQTAEYQMQTTLAKQLAVQLAGQGVRVKGAGGLQVTRAGGYIPNATKMAEVVGAQAGGYTPGRVVSSPVGGVMNTAEDVKYIPGFAQPFINPPANSKAGRTHRQNAISRTGVDPYMYGGFIPNFSNPKDVINKSYTGPLHLLQIHSLDEKEEIQKVADLETEITKRGKKEVINDKITGFGIRYVTEEIKGKSNSDYRKEAADLALSGDIEAIKKSMPKTKGSSFNATQWSYNLKDLKDKGINLSLSNIENLSRLENAVPSLITGKTVEFGRQFTGLLNALSGEAFEKDIAKQKKKLFARSEKSNARLDFESLNQLYSGGEAKLGGITLGNLVAKAIESTGRKYDNGDEDKIAFSKPIKLFVPEKHKLLNKGFIPNFAPPTSAIRIPWFKKFGNPAFDAIQPALGISKASDTETFRQINFKSTAEGADERGDSNIFAPLFEDFAFKAMQLVSQPDIKNDLIRGYVLQPKTNQKQAALDAALQESGIGIEYKGYPKKNLPGSITGELTRKYETLSKSNPAAAAKLKELIIAFNEVGHENQITSELGKKLFGPLAGTSYSQMVKNSPDLVKGLSAETNSLLNSYVKNPAFLKMAAASGFIPNFNLIKGRNSFQKNWLIETAKKRNLNLNDPDVFSKLATEFAKIYPNSQGMFGLSGGFIPNFAYKQAVMGLEESMSGNKAIFDTKPFPHIRNSSQPTFSSAIADHGGLGNALSDSMRGQKAAGLMSGGFIPNFADFDIRGTPLQRSASVGGGAVSYNKINKAVNDYIKSIDLNTTTNKQISDALTKLLPQFNLNQQSFNEVRRAAIEHAKAERQAAQQTASNTSQNNSRFAKFSEGLSKASTAISIAGPMVAGLAEQAVFGNRKRTEMTGGERFGQAALSTGLSAISTGAGIGAAFGPLGAGIGAAAGALVGLTSALNATKLSAEELVQLTESQITQQRQSIDSGEKYIQAQENYKNLLMQGVSGTELEKASKNVKTAFEEIKDVKLAKSLAEAKNGIDGLNSVLNPYKQKQKQLEKAQAVLNANPQQMEEVLYNALSDSNQKNIFQRLSAGFFYKTPEQYFNKTSLETSLIRSPGFLENGMSYEQLQTRDLNQILDNIVNVLGQGLDDEMKAGMRSKIRSSLLDPKQREQLINNLRTNYENENKFLENQGSDQIQIGFLLKTRERIQSDIIKQITEVNSILKQSEFSQKLADSISDFEISLMEGTVNPLDIAAKKAKSQKSKFTRETEDEQTKANKEFVQQNYKTLLESSQNPAFIENNIKPAIAEMLKGNFTAFERLLSGSQPVGSFAESSILGGSPSLQPKEAKLLKEAYDIYKAGESERKLNNQNQKKLIDTDIYLQNLKSKLILLQSSLVQDEIKLAAQRERFEIERKNNIELEIDAIERRQSDEANYFGLGVMGKAQTKIGFRNDILQKKLLDNEISRSKSAQTDYNEIIKMQNDNTLKQADILQSEGKGIQAAGLRSKAGLNRGIEIKDLNSLNQAITGLESTSFADPKQEEQRIRTLEKLKTVQTEINQGKIKEIELNRRLNEQELIAAKRSTSFRYGFAKGFDNLKTESELMIGRLGEDLPRMFGDGLVDGIKAAIRESDNLGEALLGVASKFLDEISTAMMRSAIYGILGNIGMGIPGISNAAAAGGMKQKGGYIRAQSGMYISGTGSGDKYPALLENGEYVLNRRAVMAMGGPAALDTLNFSAAPRFAAGGSFGNNFSDISSMESNMTTYGLEQSQLYNELRDSERQKQQEAIRKRQQRKAERNAMIGSIIAAVATAAIAAGVSNVASNVKATNAQKLSAKVQATGGAGMTNSEMGKLASYQKSGLLGKNFEYIGGTPQTGFGSIFSGPTIGKTWYQKAGSSITKPFGRRQAGGYIGSRLSDTIPTYATGGLVDMPIVKRYAVGGNVSAQRINNGAGNNSTVNNNTSASNSFNFNTTVQRDGKIEIGSNMTSYSQQDVELSQSLNTKVYEVVLDTIRKEKRFGGSLAGTRNA